jgi:hypothetical protein
MSVIPRLPGRKYGSCVLIRRLPKRRFRIFCLECKRYKTVLDGNLRKLQSCGCKQRELIAKKNTTHGHSIGHNLSPTYRRFRAMHDRCECPSSSTFYKYGALGVRVCAAWSGKDGFKNFLADLGDLPSPKHSLSRTLDLGDYAPGNVVWGTPRTPTRTATVEKATSERVP